MIISLPRLLYEAVLLILFVTLSQCATTGGYQLKSLYLQHTVNIFGWVAPFSGLDAPGKHCYAGFPSAQQSAKCPTELEAHSMLLVNKPAYFNLTNDQNTQRKEEKFRKEEKTSTCPQIAPDPLSQADKCLKHYSPWSAFAIRGFTMPSYPWLYGSKNIHMDSRIQG